MSFNVPTIVEDDFSFGQGLLFIGVTGTTPTSDVGAVRGGASLVVTRTPIRVEQGAPRLLVAQFTETVTAVLTVTSIHWNFTNLAWALGAGTTTSTADLDTISGPDVGTFTSVAVLFRHRMPAGHTVDVHLWKAQGSGTVEMTFADTLHEIPYTFEALRETTNWAGGTLSAGDQLWEMIRQKT